MTDVPVHLRSAGVSLVLAGAPDGLPQVLHWGADLGDLAADDLTAMQAAAVPPVVPNTLDEPAPLELLPQHAQGWAGLPGLRGHRDGHDWSPLFHGTWHVEAAATDTEASVVRVEARDEVAALSLDLEIRLEPSGLLRLRAGVTNDHPAEPYTVDGLVLALPVPTQAAELLDLTGRWAKERIPQRRPFHQGTLLRDSRRGRTGHDASLVLAAGAPGFAFRSGRVWLVHVAWSGNHRTYAERMPSGHAVLGGGELLLPGEVRLAPGETYRGPWLVASTGEGLDDAASRVHRWLRSRPHHPRTPRPVVLNTWEAVYFDHDLPTLTRLADAAADLGVERFVLDDGWFRGRRDDHAGLGDWYVDTDVWPDGLHPLVDHVRARGMQFGLWVEPEMVNLRSDLARAHPEWVLGTGGRVPPESRHQQVLDLAHPQAWQYVLDRMHALLSEYDIGFVKWDHNRDLVDAGHGPHGVPGVHGQTDAIYRLLDELRRRHPGVEIESCSSGGARVDLEILVRTDRIWTSDCNDALERQAIQRWTGLLVPPELMGAHVGPPVAHTTGRHHALDLRAGTALLGHFGIEWDVSSADPGERRALRDWVDAYKRLRPLLHAGDLVHGDHADPALWVTGVVSADRTAAVFQVVAVATSAQSPPGRVCLPGLEPDRRYRVQVLAPGGLPPAWGRTWASSGPLTLTGRALGVVGVQVPALWPEHLTILEVLPA
jgi:alpha-galactosidase